MSLSVSSESDDPLLQLAEEVTQEPFTTSKRFHRLLEDMHQALLHDQIRDQYITFTSVPPAQSSKLCENRSRTKYCRFSFNPEAGYLIVKVIPDPAHDLAIRSFDFLVSLELRAINVHREMRPFGSTTTTVGNWRKEPDCSWAPALTNARLSFVVEVGLSESDRRLALDARGWLESQFSSVRLVVTITVKRQTPEIIIQRWELVPREYGAVTRSSALSARRTASIRLSRTNGVTSVTAEASQDGTTTTTTDLILPFSKVIGRPPRQHSERDLVIPEQELRRFADDIWGEQNLL